MKAWPDLAIWRHPRPHGAAGRCVGRIDLPVDPRRARRLAARVHRAARREARPRVVFTSPARRSWAVGRCLRRRGWTHRVDARLLEADFGDWDGRRWDDIGADAVEAWVRRFADHRPGGGETVREVIARCVSFLQDVDVAGASVITHGGWICALEWLLRQRPAPHGQATGAALSPTAPALTASGWPRAIGYAARFGVSSSRIPGSG